jgi:hypothetical protein
MKLANISIRRAYHGESADVLVIVLPVKPIALPLRLVRSSAHFVGDVTYWVLVNIFAGSEAGYVALHKR